MKPFTLLLLAISISSFAQKNDYSSIDNYAKAIPKSESKTIEQLAKTLTKDCKNDFEKVRAFYVWIASNVSYDFSSFKSGNVPEQTAKSAFITRKAVCQGYSELFYALCKLNSIECQVISGYSKGYGYNPNKKFQTTDHAWNAVKLDGNWYLIDVTWGAGYVNEQNKYVAQFTEEHFLASPQTFIIKHLPADPLWQLIPESISIQNFEKDSAAIKILIAKPVSKYMYQDTLKYYSTLDSVSKIINSSQRIIRYNPTNAEAWYRMGWFYFQSAWQNMMQLNNPNVQKNKALARPLAKQAIDYQKEALKYLKEAEKYDSFYSEDIKQKRQIIAKNMENLEQILK